MASKSDAKTKTGCYVYGIVPGDVETESDARGIGDRPITLVRHGEIAALVSEVELDRPLGEPPDLQAHARVLDSTAAAVPVLPVHFGAVVSNEDAVAEELLAAHEEEFRAALDKLDGYAQYVLKGRYVEDALLNELLSQSKDAAQLKDAIRDKPKDATRNERLALGELVNKFIEAKRQEDTRRVLQLLDNLGLRLAPQQPGHELDAVHIACLAEIENQDELEQEIGKLADEWDGQVELRLLGPLAPYDFVTTQAPQG